MPRFAPDEPEQVERFLGEAKAAARLRHPNLVAVFESGQVGEDYFIVLEFVEGLPLSERLARRRLTSVRRRSGCATWRGRWLTPTLRG